MQILASEKIDQVKWDDCIEHSPNVLVYANYEYLNTLCDHWAALIIGDYETVLPLPWRNKWGIRYLYAPAFIQQLGFFGNLNNLNHSEIWRSIFEFAKFGDLFFNYQNEDLLLDRGIIAKTNYTISLRQTYPEIAADYTQDLVKNLQKSAKKNLHYSSELLIENCVSLFQKQYQERFPHLTNESILRFKQICLKFSKDGRCITRTVYAENELVSTAILFNHCHRLYLIMNATNETGRTLAANHFLIDQIIQEFSEEELLFDFEGSEKKGIKAFYESFHPANQPYFQQSYNKLPKWVNWIRNRR